MRCPKDKSILETLPLDMITIDVCPSCAGIWFDRAELSRLTTRLTMEYLPHITVPESITTPGSTPMNIHDARSAPTYECPQGHGTMKRTHYAGNSGVWIDSCEVCEGAWLDGGEFSSVMTQVLPNPLHDGLVRLLAEHYRDMARMEEDTAKIARILPMALYPGTGPVIFLTAVIGYLVQKLFAHMVEQASIKT